MHARQSLAASVGYACGFDADNRIYIYGYKKNVAPKANSFVQRVPTKV
jgi:hypothetical protein